MSENDSIIVWGRRPILDILRHHPERLHELYIKEGLASSFRSELLTALKGTKCTPKEVSEFELDTKAGNANHQGIVALVAPGAASFAEWLRDLSVEDNPSVIVFDHIEDVGNVGAIIRTALAAGVTAILYPKDRQAPIDGTVYKTSAGAVDRMTIVPIGNVSQALRSLKEKGFWIYGLDMQGEKSIWEESFDAPSAFVVGSEGEGIHEGVAKSCDIMLRIPMEGDMESLNASVSAAVLIYEWRRQAQIKSGKLKS